MSGSDSLEAARNACEAIARSADVALEWEWDGRFGTALAAFASEHSEAVGAVLGPHFQQAWSAADVGGSPARVQALAGRLGGLRGGQALWVGPADADTMLFCAWWPWGDGSRLSIRIGCDGPGVTQNDLEGWFGL